MIITEEMQSAIDIIRNTNECLYLTGKAGTGKTTLLRHVVGSIEKRFMITAPTGVAAVNAGGVTLHSFLNIPFGVLGPGSAQDSKFNGKKKKLAQAIDVLIIDEVSMARADVIDFVDIKLRMYRQNSEPFGGVQVIMFGDLHQLPPVVTAQERGILESLYRGPYFYNANVFREKGFRVVELTKVFRQSDERFVNILNNIRDYKLTQDDMEMLEEIRSKERSNDFSSKYIHICSLRKDVDKINAEMLGTPTHSYTATLKGKFNPASMPCDNVLNLRIGARVMTLVNDKKHRYYNGSLGEVVALTDNTVTVLLDSGETVELEPYSWEQAEYKAKDDKETGEKKVEKNVIGECSQIPLALAWAITIHKSQGLTFDNVVIHSKSMFCPGQLYVALSRCTSMEGLVSENFISPKMIFPDKELSRFEKAYREHGNVFDRIAFTNMRYESR